MDFRYTSMSKDSYDKIMDYTKKNIYVPFQSMDYGKAVGILGLMVDLEVPMENFKLIGKLKDCRRVRDLAPEIPYNVTLDAIGASFTVNRLFWQ